MGELPRTRCDEGGQCSARSKVGCRRCGGRGEVKERVRVGVGVGGGVEWERGLYAGLGLALDDGGSE